MEQAYFAAGCFWGVEEVFRTLSGVQSTEVGYMGGETQNPSYEDVCTDTTGHAEVVKVVFDPAKVSYNQLLEIFWQNHNPTTLNRQGPDEGTQYRSVVFFTTDAQADLAQNSKELLVRSGRFKNPIVTEIVRASTFWPAEEYHQKYLAKRGMTHCHL